jgi:hypothetical protein
LNGIKIDILKENEIIYKKKKQPFFVGEAPIIDRHQINFEVIDENSKVKNKMQ